VWRGRYWQARSNVDPGKTGGGEEALIDGQKPLRAKESNESAHLSPDEAQLHVLPFPPSSQSLQTEGSTVPVCTACWEIR
jgi:hypothetical protein